MKRDKRDEANKKNSLILSKIGQNADNFMQNSTDLNEIREKIECFE